MADTVRVVKTAFRRMDPDGSEEMQLMGRIEALVRRFQHLGHESKVRGLEMMTRRWFAVDASGETGLTVNAGAAGGVVGAGLAVGGGGDATCGAVKTNGARAVVKARAAAVEAEVRSGAGEKRVAAVQQEAAAVSGAGAE